MKSNVDFDLLEREWAKMIAQKRVIFKVSEVFDSFCDERNLTDAEANKLFDRLRAKHGVLPVPI